MLTSQDKGSDKTWKLGDMLLRERHIERIAAVGSEGQIKCPSQSPQIHHRSGQKPRKTQNSHGSKPMIGHDHMLVSLPKETKEQAQKWGGPYSKSCWGACMRRAK